MSITDSISSLGSSITDTVSGIVHDVSTRAPELVQTVADAGHDVAKDAIGFGRDAVGRGRHGLEAVGIVDRPSRRMLPTLLAIALIAIVTLGVAKYLRRRKAASSGAFQSSGHGAVPLRDANVA
jgi:hypothetical protein